MAKKAQKKEAVQCVAAEVITDDGLDVTAGIRIGAPELAAAKVTERKYALRAQLEQLQQEKTALQDKAVDVESKVLRAVETNAVSKLREFWTQVEKVCKGLGCRLERPKNADEAAKNSLTFNIDSAVAYIDVRAGSETTDGEEAVRVTAQRRYNLWEKTFNAQKKQYEELLEQICVKSSEIADVKVLLSPTALAEYKDDLLGSLSTNLLQTSGARGKALVAALDACAAKLQTKQIAHSSKK